MKMLKVFAFSLAVIGIYTLYAVRFVPEITPEPPPKEEAVSGAMTKDELIALGEKIYNGKGTCTLCHNPVGGRAPLLENVAVTALDRIKDPRYKGTAKDAESYIYESMVNPSAYVVAGFGVTGTNDTVSPMPDVKTGAIGLNEIEIKAVMAYLQKLGGVEVTVKLPGTVEGAAGVEGSAEGGK